MAAEDAHSNAQEQPEVTETPQVPDYLASPNAVFSDEGVQWRYGRAPDYTKTRKVWAEGEQNFHLFATSADRRADPQARTVPRQWCTAACVALCPRGKVLHT